MNCLKCNTFNREGSKFCTSCGFSFKTDQNPINSENCKKCHVMLKPGSKFCTSCGTPVNNPSVTEVESVSSTKPMSIIKDRIFWNVQKGELAHRFNEAEMMQYDSTKGIIINEGTTAYIRANGVHVAEIKGGTYDFVDPQKLDETLNQRQGGLAGGIRSGFRFLSNLVMGRRVKDSIEANESPENSIIPNTMASLIERMKEGQVFSVTLKLDKSFPLIFEINEIETSILNATFGVHTFLKIADFAKFSEYYLSDSNSVSFERIQKEFEPIIKASIQKIVHNHDLKEGRLPEELLQNITAEIESSASEFMYGLKLEKIVEISSKSEDLARFRELSKELYLSEKELEFLIRTNEFRNRLTSTQNSQRLSDASTDAEFHRALTEINNNRFVGEARQSLDFDKQMQGITQEQLLTEDEMEKFYMVLSREKRIREAKNEDEINAALLEIEKTGLLRTEDLENLKQSIRERSEDHDLQRFHSIDLLQMNQSLEIDRKKLEWEYEIGDNRIELEISRRRKELQSEIGYTQLEIERWKTEDDYKDSIFYKDLEKRKAAQLQELDLSRATRETEIDLDNKEMDAQLERLRKLKEVEAAQEKLKHEQEMAARAQELNHVKDLTQLDKEKQENLANIYQGMTFEQIMAANPNLNPDVASQLAKKFEAEAESEKFKFAQLQNDTRVNDAKELADKQSLFLKEQMQMQQQMMKDMMNTTSSMTGHLVGNKDQQKDEYKQRLERQEDRMDNTQDKALDYTTRNNSFGNANPVTNTPPPPPSDYFVNLPGENNLPRNIEALINMVKSGQLLRLTNVFVPMQNAWVPAETITELQVFFPPNSDLKSSNDSNVCKSCGFSSLEKGARFCPECGNEP